MFVKFKYTIYEVKLSQKLPQEGKLVASDITIAAWIQLKQEREKLVL